MPTFKASRYNILVECNDTHLAVHNLLRDKGFLIALDRTAHLEAVLADSERHADDPLVEHLVEAGCLIPGDLDEQAAIQQKKTDFLREQERTLSLTIIPTYQCNFKCVYCWEDTKDKRDGMPLDAQERLLSYLEQQLPSYDALNIEWFGGEPLMAFDVIKHLSERIDAMCKERRIPYFCSLTTNGYLLTEDRFRFLLQHHTRFFQVTVDGPAELHDRNRPLKIRKRDGSESTQARRGTHARIVENLRKIRDNVKGRFEMIVRINVTSETAAHVHEFLEFYKQEFAGDWRFRLYLQGVEEHDGVRADVMGDKYLGRGDDIVERLFDISIRDGIRLSSLRIDRPGDLMCKSRSESAYFVNSDGDFYKCDMCMNDEHQTYVGGVSKDGTLMQSAENLAKWNSIEPPNYCRACVLQPLCFGLKCPYYNTIQGETRCELFNSHGAARNAVRAFAQEGRYKIVS